MLFYVQRYSQVARGGWFKISAHACKRMAQRGISVQQVRTVLRYGRVRSDRGAWVYAIGNQEVKHWGKRVPEVKACRGTQVIVQAHPVRVVTTVYRNQDFRRPRDTYRRAKHIHRGNRFARRQGRKE